MTRLLLGSGGFSTPERRQGWLKELDDYLGSIRTILFVPYALKDHDYYIRKMEELGSDVGRKLVGIHTTKDPVAAVAEAEVVFIGGGNSFRLLADLYRHKLLEPIRNRVSAGMPYIGVSAGTNMACPTMKTTNDMPITYPPSLDALGLISFQINPHYIAGAIYTEPTPGTYQPYGGETRDDRIAEFHEMNTTPVLGLYEGGILRVENGRGTLRGTAGARLFLPGEPAQDFALNAEVPLPF